MDYASDSDTFIRVADQILVEQHLATCLETIVIVAGVMKVRGTTNMMKIRRVDEH